MPHRIVDLLKVIHVNHHEDKTFTAVFHNLQLFLQCGPVVEGSQVIFQQLQLQPVAFQLLLILASFFCLSK